MADVDFDDFDGGYPAGWSDQSVASGRVTRIVHLAGAACSAALVLGLAVWGYKIAVRDVNGVPVVRAMEGPMRIAPENPGGEVTDHQGLAVNTVAALGAAAPPPDRLVLAPRPLDLDPEDMAGLSQATAPVATETAPLAETLETVAAVAPLPETAAPAENLGPDPDAVAQALAEALAGADVAPVMAEPAETAVATADAAPIIRPRPRPGSAAATQQAEAAPLALTEAVPVSAPGASEIDPATIPAGTRLVQLGAFDTADQARAEWVKLSNQFGDLMLGKSLVVQQAESGGRNFFRLRAHGFANETEARGFCTSMLAQNASCIPVEQR